MTTQKSPHIEQVRQALLDTLTDLRNREQPMDIDRAKAVATVAAVLVDTARVENDYLKITGQDSSRFLETPADDLRSVPRVEGPSAHNPFPSVVRHELRG
jgi:hypothetical protein